MDSFWLEILATDPEVQVWFPVLPDLLSSGFTQPREYNWGATWKKMYWLLENQQYGHRDPLRWPCDTLYTQKLALTSLTSGGYSVSMFVHGLRPRNFFIYKQCVTVHYIVTTNVKLHYFNLAASFSKYGNIYWHMVTWYCTESIP
jgi:hypothetical protein